MNKIIIIGMYLLFLLSLTVHLFFLINYKLQYTGKFLLKLINPVKSNTFIKERKAKKIKKKLLNSIGKSGDKMYHCYNSVFDRVMMLDGELSEFFYSIFVEELSDSKKSDAVCRLKESIGFVSTISVAKKKQVRFILCNSRNDAQIELDGVLASTKVEELGGLLSCMEEIFENSEYKGKVCYDAFVRLLKQSDLIESFYYFILGINKDSFVESTSITIENTISEVLRLLYGISSFYINIKNIKYNIESSSDIFFRYIRMGVYLSDKGYKYFEFYCKYFQINLIKYILKPDNIKSLADIFSNKYGDLSGDVYGYIFDVDMFLKEANLISKGNVYNSYGHSVLKRTIMEINASEKGSDELVEIVGCEAFGYNILKCIDKNTNIYVMNTKKTRISLKKYISNSSEEQFVELIGDIIKFFSDNKKILDKLFIDKNKYLLSYFQCSEKGKKIFFTSLKSFELCGEDTLDCVAVVFESMKVFLESHNLTNIEEIYSFEFVKLLSPKFLNEFLLYWKNKEYDLDNARNGLKNMVKIPSGKKIDIEFIEDINKEYISNYIKFFDNPDVAKDFIIPCKYTTTCKAKTQMLSDVINYYAVDTNTLQKHGKYSYFPKAIICSKSKYVDNEYLVIGIKYNRANVCALTEFVERSDFDDKIALKIVSNIIDLAKNANIYFSYFEDILVDDSLNIFVKVENGRPKGVNISSRVSIQNYYENIIRWLRDYIKDERIFSLPKVLPIMDQIKINYHNLFKCTEHNLWHLSTNHCIICEEMYQYISKNDIQNKCYRDCIGSYYITNTKKLIKKTSRLEVIKNYLSDNECKEKMNSILSSNCISFILPLKVVLNVNSKYKEELGAMYDDFDFEGVMDIYNFNSIQKLKFILSLYKNLLPFIDDGTFLSSDYRIYTTMFMHRNHKGKIFIPNIELFDFVNANATSDKTREFCISREKERLKNFLIEYISSDDILSSDGEYIPDIVEDIRNCNFSKDKIEKYIDNNSNYCEIHSIFFRNDADICPICKEFLGNNAVIKHMTRHDLEYVTKGDANFDGGEAELYNYNQSELLKVFKVQVDLELKTRLLGKIFDKKEVLEAYHCQNPFVKFITVKEVIIRNDNNKFKVLAYVQDMQKDTFKISRLKEKAFVDSIGFTEKDVVEILLHICEGIEYLHANNIFIGDLNGSNVLFDKHKIVYFIDFDGMNIEDVKNQTYTDLYIYPPSAKNKNISYDDDWYSLAVQAFYYLTYSHPFKGKNSNNSDSVPEDVVMRMEKGISLLGEHELVPSNVCIGWNHLSKNLIQYFFDTFEGRKRESMLNVIKEYYTCLEKQPKFEKVDNDKTIFFDDSNSTLLVNGEVICSTKNIEFYSIWDNYILLFKSDSTILVDIEQRCIKFQTDVNLCDFEQVVPTCDALYCNYNRELIRMPYSNANNTDVLFTTHVKILTFLVKGDNKFVILVDSDDGYDIYCNKMLLCNTKKLDTVDDDKVFYYIRHDELSDKWIVIIQNKTSAKFIVIKPEGNYEEFVLDNINLGYDKEFYGNVLYYVTDGKISSININKKKQSKTIKCDVANNKSTIMRKDNKFVVYNSDGVYEYVKK